MESGIFQIESSGFRCTLLSPRWHEDNEDVLYRHATTHADIGCIVWVKFAISGVCDKGKLEA